MPPLLLRLREVVKRFDSPGNGGALTILDRVSLEVTRGESVAITGPSGSGKSTLLHIIGTLDRPSAGEVLLNGQNLGDMKDAEFAALRNGQMGFIFQAHYLLPQCTVLENVLIPTLAQTKVAPPPGLAAKSVAETAETRATRLLKRVGLGERMDHRPGQLSGGERQRVAVVRALINQPDLLLADEPTGSLDHASAERLAELLIELNREEGVAVILVTHAPELAQRMARRFELHDGRLNPV